MAVLSHGYPGLLVSTSLPISGLPTMTEVLATVFVLATLVFEYVLVQIWLGKATPKTYDAKLLTTTVLNVIWTVLFFLVVSPHGLCR